jgi:hypothetical protein
LQIHGVFFKAYLLFLDASTNQRLINWRHPFSHALRLFMQTKMAKKPGVDVNALISAVKDNPALGTYGNLN